MVEVLFFAELRDVVGEEKISLDVENITIKELKEKIKSSYNLKALDHAMVAINEEYVQEDQIIQSGDTIAFIPPVSGG